MRTVIHGARLSAAKDAETIDPKFNQIQHTKRRVYLVSLSRNWNFNQAALAADIDRVTGWLWRTDLEDKAFQTALQQAAEIFIERAEVELWRRGIDGVEKPVYQGGRLVGTVREYDTTAAIFMMKGAKPEKYRERFEHTGAGGVPLFALPLACRVDLGNLPKEDA
mgnify:FL=1